MSSKIKYDFSGSRLNSPMLRIFDIFINAILLFGICSSKIYLKSTYILLAIVLGLFLLYFSYCSIMKHVEFLEWDYFERKKKAGFIEVYLLINGFFSIMFSFSLVIALSAFFSDEENSMIIYLFYLLPVLVYLLNMVYTVSIWFNCFESDLTISYNIQNKPKNWIDNSKHIQEREMSIEEQYGIR